MKTRKILAITRHKDAAKLYISNEETKSFEHLCRTMGRDRYKESALDYLECENANEAVVTGEPLND